MVLAIYQSRATLRNRVVAIYTDNDAAMAAIVNGDSPSLAAYALIDVFGAGGVL